MNISLPIEKLICVSFWVELLTLFAIILRIALPILEIVAVIRCGVLAHQKNRSIGLWIFLGLFFGIIAWIIIGRLSDLSAETVYADSDYTPNTNPSAWTCSCGTTNSPTATVCSNCQKPAPRPTSRPGYAYKKSLSQKLSDAQSDFSGWVCDCGTRNDSRSKVCTSCFKKKPE